MHYQSCAESVLTFLFLCWFGDSSVKRKNVLSKVVNVCGKVVGEKQECSSQLYECHVVQKAWVIIGDGSHELAKHKLLSSGRQFHT